MQKIQNYMYIYINTIQKIQNSGKNRKSKKNIESINFTVENQKKIQKIQKT